MVRRVTLLWHGDRPVGICVFTAPAAALRLRHEFFGVGASQVAGCGRSLWLKQLNAQLWLLARVVLHPTYRGAGVAAAFVRRSCATCPVPWIETLSALGQVNPFFEKAGFVRVGVVNKKGRRRDASYARIYGSGRVSQETLRKSRHSQPVYYVFDNRPCERSVTSSE